MATTRYFTFGSEHAHPLGSYVKITAASAQACREEMFRRFGNKWAFEYPEETFVDQIEKHGLKEVKLEENVTDMYFCEIPRLILHEDQLYRFHVDQNCEKCLAYTKGEYGATKETDSSTHMG